MLTRGSTRGNRWIYAAGPWWIWTSLPHANSSGHRAYLSSSCPSTRAFATRFLQTPSHNDALALRYPSPPPGWERDFHPSSQPACPAHVNTPPAKAGGYGFRLKAGLIGHSADYPPFPQGEGWERGINHKRLFLIHTPSSWPSKQLLHASPKAPTVGALPPASMPSIRRVKAFNFAHPA